MHPEREREVPIVQIDMVPIVRSGSISACIWPLHIMANLRFVSFSDALSLNCSTAKCYQSTIISQRTGTESSWPKDESDIYSCVFG